MKEAPQHILVVDDNPTNRKLLLAILEAENYITYEAPDGEAALKLLEQTKVDAIISDILMPNMDGYRLCYEIRKSQRHSTLPFIFFTATYTSPSDEKLAMDLGADRMLKKPVSSTEVLQTLTEVLHNPHFQEQRIIVQPKTIEVIKEYRDALVTKLEEKHVALIKRTDELEREIVRRQESEDAVRRLNEDLEQKVAQRTAELQTANAELKAFAQSVSHDLRNPLSAINGFIYLFLNKQHDYSEEDLRKTARGIDRAARRMGQIIEDFLMLSGIGRKPFQAQTFDLSAMTREVIDVLQARDRDRKVEIFIAPGMEVHADQGLMRILIENLIGNAWKFTRGVSEPKIEARCFKGDSLDTFFVRDNGAGFDMMYADKLFSPFSRLHTQDEFEGTGIGLSIVQRIILRHGGRVWAEAVIGRGATFFFSMPDGRGWKGRLSGQANVSSAELPINGIGSER